MASNYERDEEPGFRPSDEHHALGMTWDGPAGMPGRSQPGQLLNPDDDASDATDSDTEARPATDAPKPEQPATGGAAARPSQPAYQESKPPAGDDESGTDTDEDGELIKAKAKAVQEKAKQAPLPTAKRRVSGKPRAGAGITLGLLIKEGLLWPGKDVLSVEYKSVMTYATLTQDGQIVCQINGNDATFESPSAFSIFLKRMVNPNRKADDGWKTVKFNGRFLETYKLELAKRRLAASGEVEPSPEPASKKAKLDGQPGKAAAKPKAPRKAANGHSAVRPVKAAVIGSNLEEVSQMIPCERFRGEPGGPGSNSQPFRVVVSPAAAVFMDFHAHLSNNEITGFLEGTWLPEKRLLRVEKAVPVQEVQSPADSDAVKMDPRDEAAVRQTITKQHGLRCVGWYHSHPHAATHPSTSDILRQIELQKAHRDEGSGAEPFIGAILGPYPNTREDKRGSVAYFCVDYPRDAPLPPGCDPVAEGCLPMEVQVEDDASPDAQADITAALAPPMRVVAQRCAANSRRADLLGPWPGGGTKLQKLQASLAAHLPAGWPEKRTQDFLAMADAIVAAAWKVFGKAAPPAGKAEEEDLEISDVTQDGGPGSATADDASGGVNSGQPQHANGNEEPEAHTLFEHNGGFPGGLEGEPLLEGHPQFRGGYEEDEDISE